MADLFEMEPDETDPYLDRLFMKTAMGGIGVTLDTYMDAIRRGISPEEAYNRAISIPDEV